MTLITVNDAQGAKMILNLDSIIMISAPNVLAGGASTYRIFLQGVFFDVQPRDGDAVIEAWKKRQKELIIQ